MWKKFFNNPRLWVLGAGIVLIICIVVGITSSVLITEKSTSVAFVNIACTKNIGAQVLSGYVFLVGSTIGYYNDNGIIGATRTTYNTAAAVILLGTLFLGTIGITRQSNSAIYLLGPLFVYFVVAVIVLVIGTNPASSAVRVGIVGMSAIINWLGLVGGISVLSFAITKLLIRLRLVKGIDENGPLDLSRLQTAGAKIISGICIIANTVGKEASKIIESTATGQQANHQPNSNATTKQTGRSCESCGTMQQNPGKFCGNCGATMQLRVFN